jgi:hypothetical protein
MRAECWATSLEADKAHQGTGRSPFEQFTFTFSYSPSTDSTKPDEGLIPCTELTFISQNLKFGLSFFLFFDPEDPPNAPESMERPIWRASPPSHRVVQEAKIGTRFTGSCR